MSETFNCIDCNITKITEVQCMDIIGMIELRLNVTGKGDYCLSCFYFNFIDPGEA